MLQEEQIAEILAILRDHHPETYEHVLRVCRLCLDIGFENGLGSDDLKALGYAGLLHDIGKTQIPLDILTKTGGLDSQEMIVMRGHVRRGFLELDDLKSGIMKSIIAAHHEFSIHPYPRTGGQRRQTNRQSSDRREADPQIRVLAQILAVADVVDALAHRRSYKEALSKEEIAEILKREFTGEVRFLQQALHRLPD